MVPNIPSVKQFFAVFRHFRAYGTSERELTLSERELTLLSAYGTSERELTLLSSVDQYASFDTPQVKSTVKLRIFIFLVFFKGRGQKMNVLVKIKIGTYENILVQPLFLN